MGVSFFSPETGGVFQSPNPFPVLASLVKDERMRNFSLQDAFPFPEVSAGLS